MQKKVREIYQQKIFDDVSKSTPILQSLSEDVFFENSTQASFSSILGRINELKDRLSPEELRVIDDLKKHVDYYLSNKKLRDVEHWKDCKDDLGL